MEEKETETIDGFKLFLKNDFEKFKKECEENDNWKITYDQNGKLLF
jgi:hypothetical protein